MTPREIPPQVKGLWPWPAEVTVSRSGRDDETGYYVVPSLKRPRILVPVDVRGADRMFARHGGSKAERAARAAWQRAHRSGLAGRLPLQRLLVTPAPDGIEAYLADALGVAVRIGVLLGPPRANLKPVVQVFNERGDTIAFAKLGLTRLTEGLLATEAAALARLAETSVFSFVAPPLLHHGSWNDIPVLVQGALALAQDDRAPTEPPVRVMAEIAKLDGVAEHGLGDSSFLDSVQPHPDADWHGIDLDVFNRLHEALAAADPALPFGSWHGDFGPWNMGSDGVRVEVWDWERFATGVPVGLDAAHYRTQRGVAEQTPAADAWSQITAEVAEVLVACERDAELAPTVGGCYLLAICARYRGDAHDGPTPALRRRLGWLSLVADLALANIQEQSR